MSWHDEGSENLGAFFPMNKDEKDLRASRDREEAEVLRRVLFWLGAAVLLETLVLLGNRFYFNYLMSEFSLVEKLNGAMKVLQFAGFAVALVFVIWALMGRRTNQHAGIARIISATFFAAISVCAILFLHVGSSSVSVLLVAIPSLGGLIMIYYLYQREFFLLATASGLGILGLWIFRTGHVNYTVFYYVYAAVLLCLLAGLSAFAVNLQKKDGVMEWHGKSIALLKPGAHYKTIWITAGVVAAFLVLAPLLGVTFAYYAFLALIVWIFVMAVYFTSRLM